MEELADSLDIHKATQTDFEILVVCIGHAVMMENQIVRF